MVEPKREPKFAEYYQVYIWQLPVRFFHWTNATCLLVLSVTGYLMANPIALQSSAEASYRYIFGQIRFVHFAFAYIFTVNFAARVYWGFVGNRFSKWKNFITHTPRQIREAWKVLCLDLLQICKLPLSSIGINGLAGIIYPLVYLIILFQIVTGFGLYAAMSRSRFPKLFTWVVPLMGGDVVVRQWHHVMTWVLLVFTAFHIYLSWYHDYLEGRGTMSSMIGGWKFIEKEVR